jgi:hypothetical protein
VNWEAEVRWNLAKRADDELGNPYAEARMWRRLCWLLIFFDVILGGVYWASR